MFLDENAIKKAFKRVKADVLGLKNSVNEWILFLNSNQREMKRKLHELERRLAKLESDKFEDLRRI